MTAALIPVKSLRESKSRLAAVLSPEQRQQLTIAMLSDVVGAALAAGLGPVLVISRDTDVLRGATAAGARGMVEPPGIDTLNGAIEYGLKTLLRHGENHVLVILGDVPSASAADLRVADRLLRQAEVVVIPADDGGTNVLGLRLPSTVRVAFGRDSAARHYELATFAEADLISEALPSLRRDIDSPEGLEWFLNHGPEGWTMALLRTLALPTPVA